MSDPAASQEPPSGLKEHWHLDHPTRGALDVYVGSAEALAHIDPGYPVNKKAGAAGKAGSEDKNSEHSAWDSEIGEVRARLIKKSRLDRLGAVRDLEFPEFLVMRDGVVIARRRMLATLKIDLGKRSGEVPEGKHGAKVAGGPPYLKLHPNFLDTHLNEVHVRADGEVVLSLIHI